MGTLMKNGINYTGAEGGSTTPTNLNGLTDVEISSPSTGQVMKYNTTSAQWENENNDLDNLSNVNISSPANDQVLKYNSSTGKWVNGAGGGGSSSESYSTSEQVIGTWINGETLYQRTYTGSLSSSANETNIGGFSSSYRVVDAAGYVIWGTTAQRITLPFSDGTGKVGVYTDTGGLYISARENNNGYRGCSYVLTVKYTH